MGVPVYIDGVASIAHRFDAFLVDAWGVLHDGATANRSAVDALLAMRSEGKSVVILSNAARRESLFVREMSRLAIDDSHFDHIVTSGEMTWQALKTRVDPWHRRLGRRCYFLGPQRSLGILEGLDLAVTNDLGEAEFILNTGSPVDAVDTSGSMAVLEEAFSQKLPMVCANPDQVAIRAGVLGISAGTLAKAYQALGGEVHYHGKPHAPAYQACMKCLPKTQPSRVLAIGDGMVTDILGANRFGLASLLVTTGIHRDEISIARRADDLVRLSRDYGANPDYVTGPLAW